VNAAMWPSFAGGSYHPSNSQQFPLSQSFPPHPSSPLLASVASCAQDAQIASPTSQYGPVQQYNSHLSFQTFPPHVPHPATSTLPARPLPGSSCNGLPPALNDIDGGLQRTSGPTRNVRQGRKSSVTTSAAAAASFGSGALATTQKKATAKRGRGKTAVATMPQVMPPPMTGGMGPSQHDILPTYSYQ
jgi:hypothetical protein